MSQTPDSVIQSLAAAVKGLTYPSESDEPFDVVHWPGKDGQSAREVVLAHSDRKRKLEQVPVQEFFSGLTEADDTDRFRKLHALIESQLKELAIFRVGEGEVDVDIYAVGRLPNADWVGFHTVSVET